MVCCGDEVTHFSVYVVEMFSGRNGKRDYILNKAVINTAQWQSPRDCMIRGEP